METQSLCLLRIYTDEEAALGDRRMFDVLLDRARESRLLGATVHRAQTGFGHGAHLHRRGILDHNCPVIVEIVDEEARLREFWSAIAPLAGLGLVTLERVEALRGGRATLPETGASGDPGAKPS